MTPDRTALGGGAWRGPFFAAAMLCAAPAAAQQACAPAAPPLAEVCYGDPVTRYGHDVLGDTPEWGALSLRMADGRAARVALPRDAIFEDVAPRPVSAAALGLPPGALAGVVTVESGLSDGARLVIWAAEPAGDGIILRRAAQTPAIGRPYRWLAPVAIGDLDGDGIAEIAYVETPHLRGLLRIWRLSPDGLHEVAQAAGFSNHRIGEPAIGGFLRTCGDGPELVLPELTRKRLMAVRLAEGRIEARPIGSPDAVGIALAAECGEAVPSGD